MQSKGSGNKRSNELEGELTLELLKSGSNSEALSEMNDDERPAADIKPWASSHMPNKVHLIPSDPRNGTLVPIVGPSLQLDFQGSDDIKQK